MSNILDLSCKEAARLMSVRRDRALRSDEETSLRDHLLECLNCQAFDRQLDVLTAMAKRFGVGVKPKADGNTG